jgi:hypothetical protein
MLGFEAIGCAVEAVQLIRVRMAVGEVSAVQRLGASPIR